MNQKGLSRLFAVFLIFLSFSLLLSLRLVFIQIWQYPLWKKFAFKQQQVVLTSPALRGKIFDRNLKELAINLQTNSVFAVPKAIIDKEGQAKQFSQLLGLDEAYVLGRLKRSNYFVWLDRHLLPEVAEKIKSSDLKNIGIVREYQRFYPQGKFAAQVLGCVDIDNRGLEGIELYYEKYLKGEDGWRIVERDAKRRELFTYEQESVLPKDGMDLVLNLDGYIQHIAEKELDAYFQKYRAKSGTVIVMEPDTGAVLAMACRPEFDPNQPAKSDADTRRNRTISDIYEPGSVFKIVTASALLEENCVTLEERFFCENGKYVAPHHVLHDHTPHGWLRFREVIAYSSNIGTAKAALKLGNDRLYQWIRKFGFGKKTGIDLPGEVSGIAYSPRRWSKVSPYTIPIGQEVAVNSLQLACAICAVANGGNLLRPQMIKEIRDKEGKAVKSFQPQVIRCLYSAQTAQKIKKTLSEVVEYGTGMLAAVPGYKTAGKTGTGQKLEASGIYSHTKFVASFIGFAPVENPKIAVVVVLDEPKPFYYGGVVCTPIFQKVVSQTLRYLKVPAEESLLQKSAKK